MSTNPGGMMENPAARDLVAAAGFEHASSPTKAGLTPTQNGELSFSGLPISCILCSGETRIRPCFLRYAKICEQNMLNP
jgi:hypothetical protein